MSAPLAGRRVLLTRRWPDLAAGVVALGGEAAEVPVIEIAAPEDSRALDDALRRLAEYDWLVFTSASAVEALAARLALVGTRMPSAIRMASVGPATTEALRATWPTARVDVQPAAEFRGASLVEAFGAHDLAGRRVLLPVSDRAAATVEHGLTSKGARVDRIVAYRTQATSGGRDSLLRALAAGVDAVVFASPSAIEAFGAVAGEPGRAARAVAIGPTTAAAARAAGLTVLAVAEPSTVEGLLAALGRVLGPPRAAGAP